MVTAKTKIHRPTVAPSMFGTAFDSTSAKAASAEANKVPKTTSRAIETATVAAIRVPSALPVPRLRIAPKPRESQGRERNPAATDISEAAAMARMDRPPATASAPVSAAVSRQSTTSQPADRTVPTPSRATVAAAHPNRAGSSSRAVRVSCGQGTLVCRGRCGISRAAVRARVPASAVTSQPTPPSVSGRLIAATRAAAASAAIVAGAAGRTGPGQRWPKAETAGQGPCSGGVTGDWGCGRGCGGGCGCGLVATVVSGRGAPAGGW